MENELMEAVTSLKVSYDELDLPSVSLLEKVSKTTENVNKAVHVVDEFTSKLRKEGIKKVANSEKSLSEVVDTIGRIKNSLEGTGKRNRTLEVAKMKASRGLPPRMKAILPVIQSLKDVVAGLLVWIYESLQDYKIMDASEEGAPEESSDEKPEVDEEKAQPENPPKDEEDKTPKDRKKPKKRGNRDEDREEEVQDERG